mmetsp:Transcript_48127/g.142032  ORF Transcript_48127/g.142032 Transcript_48127/m.142032 type:complete len:229 (+) Transcript_48127:859-1545(+)
MEPGPPGERARPGARRGAGQHRGAAPEGDPQPVPGSDRLGPGRARQGEQGQGRRGLQERRLARRRRVLRASHQPHAGGREAVLEPLRVLRQAEEVRQGAGGRQKVRLSEPGLAQGLLPPGAGATGPAAVGGGRRLLQGGPLPRSRERGLGEGDREDGGGAVQVRHPSQGAAQTEEGGRHDDGAERGHHGGRARGHAGRRHAGEGRGQEPQGGRRVGHEGRGACKAARA